jgi:hypothetical protein
MTRYAEQFLHEYDSLSKVLTDKPLAALGDAYVNFIYSLALSRKSGKPRGKKVKGSSLAEAVRRAGLRSFLPSRVDKHILSDAAEALLVYAWLHDVITMEESVKALEKSDDVEKGLAELLLKAKEKIKL